MPGHSFDHPLKLCLRVAWSFAPLDVLYIDVFLLFTLKWLGIDTGRIEYWYYSGLRKVKDMLRKVGSLHKCEEPGGTVGGPPRVKEWAAGGWMAYSVGELLYR